MTPLEPPRLRSLPTALRIEVMEPRPQCPVRPTCLTTLWESVTGRAHWGNFRACSRPCNCGAEPERVIAAETVLREDEEGRPWLMNREAGGWAEYGIPLASWATILRYRVRFGEHIERDQDSRFIRVYPEQAPLPRPVPGDERS